jgi:hypothetical protein
MKYFAIQLMIFVLFISACSQSEKQGIKLLKTSEEMQNEVARFISLDMSIYEAREILEKSKFSCVDNKNSSFLFEKRDQYEQPISRVNVNGDFLYCSFIQPYFIASKSWGVFILYKESKVTMIHAVVNNQNF